MDRKSLLSLGWCGSVALLLLAGLLGCKNERAPDLPRGEFELHLEGELVDTLRGQARYREEDGTLVGLELGAKDGPGLSVEFTPRTAARRTYRVVDQLPSNEEGPSGLVAFLVTDDAELEATQGTLEILYVDPGEMGVTFDLEMDGIVGKSPRDVSVRVTGSARAIAGE